MSSHHSGRHSLPITPKDSHRLSHSQNFLVDEQLIQRLLSYVELGQADTVLEIGPGRGALTDALARLVPRVIAVEADTRLLFALLNRFAACHRIMIVHGDFLDYPLPARPFIVVANIPFNHTAEIVHKLADEESGLRSAYLIMQQEAAYKYTGRPERESHLLSHFLQLTFSVDYLCQIPRSCFSPKPSVDIAFVSIRKRKNPVLNSNDARQFKDLLSYLFGRSRSSLHDALELVFSPIQVDLLFHSLRLDSGLRLSSISFIDWVNICFFFAEHGSVAAQSRIQGAYAKLLKDQAMLWKRHRTTQVSGRK